MLHIDKTLKAKTSRCAVLDNASFSLGSGRLSHAIHMSGCPGCESRPAGTRPGALGQNVARPLVHAAFGAGIGRFQRLNRSNSSPGRRYSVPDPGQNRYTLTFSDWGVGTNDGASAPRRGGIRG